MKSLLVSIVFIYVLLLGYLFLAQRSFIYFPSYTTQVEVTPNLEIKNSGLLLRGWQLNSNRSDAIIYFGGNGESVEYNLPEFQKMFPNMAVYMLAYRGYGASEGSPTEAGLYSDAMALYDDVASRHARIHVIGRSLGSAIASKLAAERKVDRLALVTPFSSMVDMGKRQFPIFPISLLLKDRYESDQRAAKILSPTMVIYAGSDNVVPEASTMALIASFKATRPAVYKINNAGHNSISGFPEYKKQMQDFFSQTE